MDFGGDLWEIATNIPLESHRNRNEIADSLYLRQTFHRRVRQKLHQKSHV